MAAQSSHLGLLSAVLLVLLISPSASASGRRFQIPSPPPAHAEDIGPNTTNGSVTSPYGNAETAGQPVTLAGNSSALYLVTLNAGIWRSLNNRPWVQLHASPPRAYTIAIDPLNSMHIVVGERDGDAQDIHRNAAGLWDSSDGGETWTNTFDPLTLSNCSTQAIPSICFSNLGTLFVATPCGIGRRPVGASRPDFTHTPPGLDEVTRIIASETRVWARTASKLLVSDTDGESWTVLPIPPSRNGLSINFLGYNGAHEFTLGAFDSGAYMLFEPDANPSNHLFLLIYDAAHSTWTPQELAAGNGTGCGARLSIESFVLDRHDLPATVGQRLQLLINAGQGILSVTGLAPDGTVSGFTTVASTSGLCTTLHTYPIHPDIWDVHMAADGSRIWLADDGGVYTKAWPGGSWSTQNQDLLTHYIFTLNVMHTDQPGHTRFVYAGVDNDTWFFDDRIPRWTCINAFGDANGSAADAANPNIALAWRSPVLAALIGFNDPLPNGQRVQSNIVLSNDVSRGIPVFIQTLRDESLLYPLLDAVALVLPPLQYRDGSNNLVPVPGVLGQPNPQGRIALVRNRAFAASPDANASRFQTWEVVADDLPSDALQVWVSGGHAHPVFYVYASGPPLGARLLRRDVSGTGWSAVRVTDIAEGEWHGPAFVNPYDPQRIYVLTGSGIKVSSNGGDSFADETALTALLTGSGKYPSAGAFSGGNGAHVPRGIGSRATPMGYLSDMAFSRETPDVIVAASPFTGVFFNSGDGRWNDVTPLLPRPLPSVSSVGIDEQYIYVGTQGRGLLRVVRPDRCATPPTVACPSDVTVECTGFGGTPASDRQLLAFFASATAVGTCDPSPVLSNDAPAVFPVGTRAVTFSAADKAGNLAQCTANVTVLDRIPPTITVSLKPSSLWPPNHKMVAIHATVVSADQCDPQPRIRLLSITSNEAADASGDGHSSSDIEGAQIGTPDYDFLLRSERAGGADGRQYVVCYEAEDASGNRTSACDAVSVAHDEEGRVALQTAGGSPTLVVFGTQAFSVRRVHDAEVGTELFDRVSCTPKDPTWEDRDGDGVEDAVFRFDAAGRTKVMDALASRAQLYGGWRTNTGAAYSRLSGPASKDKVGPGSANRLGDEPPREVSMRIEPNPVLGSAVVQYALPYTGPVSLRIYDLVGREIARVVDGSRTAGIHEIRWSPGERRAQVLLYRLEACGKTLTGRFVVLR